MASTGDAADNDGWAITAGNTDGSDGDGNLPFAINSGTGAITVNDADDVDRESTASYTLTVSISDGTGADVTADVVVTITDVNDNTPIFDDDDSDGESSTAAASVAENVQTVGTYDATDADSNPTLAYSIIAVGANGASVDSALFLSLIHISEPTRPY